MLSRAAYILSVALMCYASFFFYPRWNKWNTELSISWDVSGYYWYLPSVFIYHDLKGQSFKDSVMRHYHPTGDDFQQASKLPDGNYVMKYSSGMAVMYLPFFAIAHLAAGPLGFPRDGFSAPYQFAMQYGALLVALIGLWYLRRLLLHFYSDKVVAITLLLLVFGTNYLNYATVDNGMSHSWLFTVYVFLLLNTVYFYRSFQTKYAVRIGLLVGLAALTRPTDALSAIIPLLWGMESLAPAALRYRLRLIARQYKPLLLAVACSVAVVSIQVIYWKYATGHWLYYSYNDQHIYFRSPNIVNYTFSFGSGWLLYTPMMCLAFIGLIPFVRTGSNKVAIIAFFLLNYYIVCSWNIWWYGGRAMVQSYPVLLFPFAALIQAALTRRWLAAALVPAALLFIYCNLWITWQYHRGGLYDTETMTKDYYLRVAGRWSVPERTLQLRDKTELFEGAPQNEQLLYENDFARDTGAQYTSLPGTDTRALLLDKDHQGSPAYAFPFTGSGARWLRVEGNFMSPLMEADTWKMPQFIVRLIDTTKAGDGRIVKENMFRISRFLTNDRQCRLAIDVQLPNARYNCVNILFWNGDSGKQLFISGLKAWQFK